MNIKGSFYVKRPISCELKNIPCLPFRYAHASHLFAGYAKCNSDNVNDIFNSARQIAKILSYIKEIMRFKRTNSVSMMLIEQWKKSLKKDRFEELTAILQTEPSDLFDQPNIEDFFRGWY